MHRFLANNEEVKVNPVDVVGKDYKPLDEILGGEDYPDFSELNSLDEILGEDEDEEELKKETLPHMELHQQRLKTGVVSNFLIRDSGVKFPCLILEGITESCIVKNLNNKGLLALSNNPNVKKVIMYFRIENKVLELREIDYNLENITVLKSLDKNLIMSYYENEDLPPKSPSIEDLLKMEVIEL